MNNKELLATTMTSYDYYLQVAKAVVQELDQGREGHLSLRYLDRKIKILNEFTEQMRIAMRRQDNE